MDFSFTDEQRMTAEAVGSLLDDLCQPADLRRLMQSGEARDEARWSALTALGLQGVLVPEERGGLGLAEADFVLVAEACGGACLPEPLVENAGIALPLLAAVADDKRSFAILDRALSGEITLAVAHPANPFVADADTAAAVLRIHGDELHLQDAGDLSLVEQKSIDPFRCLFSIADAPSTATAICSLADAQPHLDRALERGALFAAAQLVGIAQRAVDLAVAYAKDRNQFGKPIGSYQAVKHMLAEAQVKIEFARPVVCAAATAVAHADIYGRARVSHAKLAAADAANEACRTAIQVHGAMGYSWEVDVHLYLKRALALTGWWGDEAFHRARVAERIRSRPLGADMLFATEATRA